jgi:hypothetical protein
MKKDEQRFGDMAQAGEHLPSKYKAFISNHRTLFSIPPTKNP